MPLKHDGCITWPPGFTDTSPNSHLHPLHQMLNKDVQIWHYIKGRRATRYSEVFQDGTGPVLYKDTLIGCFLLEGKTCLDYCNVLAFLLLVFFFFQILLIQRQSAFKIYSADILLLPTILIFYFSLTF